MKIKIITDSEELEQFTSREDITISKIDIRSCEQSSFAQQWFVAVVMYEENTGNNFDWQSFRNQAAKDILCAIIASPSIIKLKDDKENLIEFCKEDACKVSILYANELCKQLKEKEEK